ncbi:NAD-dependent succinate-semialdehyde dehydrogenase [Actinoplanes sp. N902-109]|uniref:NAD-dependent succinate-semialdehyde dehydrogenase n=1 Tax=Actinoplanes sp. (strain N902-109) TaxID=649831 RepID=UPI0003293A39|nr:NAD-dependent succinate-semialdehyde dehydrogenase [Actinoplanes sp. N902-109]AGL20654.1 succinate-semialdehyde dehydrogenase (NADP+) [Actinoplanes sp. N902-109]
MSSVLSTAPTGLAALPPGARQLLRDSCLIDGRWQAALDGRTFAVDDPATGATIGRVPLMGAAEADAAVAAAGRAQQLWARRTAKDRAAVLDRWAAALRERRADLAAILTLEQGKPLAEASAEIEYAASFLTFFAAEAPRITGEIIPGHRPDARIMVLRQAAGVAACITPWNFPAAMVTRKAAPALAAGCTVVLKPAEQTPLTALAVAALGELSGLPAGTLNVITGDAPAIGRVWCDHPAVRVLSFTGSTEVGKLLAERGARTVKRLSLELGGNAAFLVFADADLDAAVEGAVLSKFRHSGQTCVCTNRFLVEDSVAEEFTARFAERIATLRVGNGFHEGTDVGPLIDDDAVAKVTGHLSDAVGRGAALLAGGETEPGSRFVTPALVGGVTADMRVMTEETFGPLAAVARFGSEQEALALANNTRSGLAGYLWTRDLARSWRVSEGLEVGMVGVNTGFLSVETAPFGGVKESGLGREGSRHGIEEFLDLKYLCLGGIG